MRIVLKLKLKWLERELSELSELNGLHGAVGKRPSKRWRRVLATKKLAGPDGRAAAPIVGRAIAQ